MLNKTQPNWWRRAVAYQVYPKSFQDTTGSGTGDLQGIIRRLDYLAELGIDVIWLSPVFASPQVDNGYDISDYRAIDPRFGTMEDMDELIAKAKERGIGIVMDLVVNHCSDEHEWFQKACQDPDGRYGRFFYIEDWDGEHLPCNWRSAFGGSVWEPLPGHPDKIYLHTFHKKQPDLNWENPELREEIYKMVNWWLDKGLAGFRIDAIINIKKVLPYRDYPADRSDGMCSISTMNYHAKGIGQFLGEMADRCFTPHHAFTAGEVFYVNDEDLPEFIGDNGYFSSMFDFNETVCNASDKGWYDQKPITPEQYKACCFESQKKVAGFDGFLSNIIENHDEPRGVSRYIPKGECTVRGKKMLGGLNFLLRGLPFIYQGQELGMENLAVNSIDEVDDISARDEYQVALNAGLTEQQAMDAVNMFSRDNARTPFQWDTTENAGFTTGKPWLHVNPNYKEINLEAQRNDPDSVYQFYRTLIQLRKKSELEDAIIYGETVPYRVEQKNLMAYLRKGEKNTVLVMGNFQPEAQTVPLPGAVKQVLLNNCDTAAIADGAVTLEGYQLLVLWME
ncbi:MAG TPA: alpha-glucosidase [Candidatus Gemmiger excrementigallinarum]|uniref:Alpha-glucosidase n=1 Tax=Candidatus Gemmiger excrementigallinarum TaxID=2838609 RepID=A0A9D2ERW4_9FIRM|nr:alpha-glucosidase [Candidatus Gemmiger excrementigallinarum]